MSDQKRLSVDELTRLAFICGEQDRASLADCWPAGSPEREAAAWQAEQMREYRMKRWGRTNMEAMLERAELRTIPLPNPFPAPREK